MRIRKLLFCAITLVFILGCLAVCWADEGDSLWSQTYGGSGGDQAFSIIPSGDGGYLLAGGTTSFGMGEWDMWLVKVNAQGDSLWSRRYSDYNDQWANSIISAGDGGFLLAGRTQTYGSGDYNIWLVKVDAEGDSLWSRAYGELGGDNQDYSLCIIPSGDGGFLLAGATTSFGAGSYDMWLLKVNAQGDSLWSRTYGGTNTDGAYSIIPAGDGNFLLAGWTNSFSAGNSDMWLVKVNSSGDSIWSCTYGGAYLDVAHCIIPSGMADFC